MLKLVAPHRRFFADVFSFDFSIAFVRSSHSLPPQAKNSDVEANWVNKMWENDNMVEQQQTNVVFREKIVEKLHRPYPSWKKQKVRYSLIKFNEFN